MHGSLLTEKRVALWSSLFEGENLKKLAASLAVGVIAGVVVSFVRLNLGLPGHKALFWMIPVLTMRMLGKSKIGTSAGAAAVILTTYSTGGHLGGGALGFPLILLGAVILDVVISTLEQRQMPFWFHTLIVSFTTILCNLFCMVKKLFVPDGLGFHLLLNNSGFWFRFFSYVFWGFISGAIACIIAYYCIRKRH